MPARSVKFSSKGQVSLLFIKLIILTRIKSCLLDLIMRDRNPKKNLEKGKNRLKSSLIHHLRLKSQEKQPKRWIRSLHMGTEIREDSLKGMNLHNEPISPTSGMNCKGITSLIFRQLRNLSTKGQTLKASRTRTSTKPEQPALPKLRMKFSR